MSVRKKLERKPNLRYKGLLPYNIGGGPSQPRAVLCAAEHDEGIYRLHALA
jgi:hypothetical protein